MPFLPTVMGRLIAAISQDLSAGTGGIDLDNIDERSDVELVETSDGGWMAVRTAAVEEQAKVREPPIKITIHPSSFVSF